MLHCPPPSRLSHVKSVPGLGPLVRMLEKLKSDVAIFVCVLAVYMVGITIAFTIAFGRYKQQMKGGGQGEG